MSKNLADFGINFRSEEQETFKFLTESDWRLLLEKAERVSYPQGQAIIEEGAKRKAIFVVQNGTVRVERAAPDSMPALLAQFGPGAVFGEMSFLEDRGASAAVLAGTAVDLYVIEDVYVHSLLMSVSGFATRFYHSLAVTLARRLRESSDRLSRLNLNAPFGV